MQHTESLPTDCNEGYYRKDNRCYPYAPAAAASTQSSTSSDAQVDVKEFVASTSDNNVLASVKAFTGTNTGGIASWFHTNSGSDSTNVSLLHVAFAAHR